MTTSRLFTCLAFSFGLFASAHYAAAGSISSGKPGSPKERRILRVSTFNIRYYGIGGSLAGTPQSETRDLPLKQFIASELGNSDVISFEEIVDVARLQKKVLPAGWECLSYENSNPKHQHVALCHRPGFSFGHEPSDDNDVIDAVAIDPSKSRPALDLILKDSSGREIVRFISVHLKAFPEESLTRQKQAGIIADFLRHLNSRLPVIVTGDFNTYPSPANKQKEGDEELIQDIFDAHNAGLVQVPNPFKYTYRTTTMASRFDHFWVSPELTVAEPLKVFRVCNQTKPGSGLDDLEYYYKNISDHCPVTVGLEY